MFPQHSTKNDTTTFRKLLVLRGHIISLGSQAEKLDFKKMDVLLKESVI